MLRTYEGTIQDGRVDWSGEAPVTRRPLRVHITVLEEESPNENRGQRMAGALGRLAESEAFAEIGDPPEWQREVRQDRSLPGREKK